MNMLPRAESCLHGILRARCMACLMPGRATAPFIRISLINNIRIFVSHATASTYSILGSHRTRLACGRRPCTGTAEGDRPSNLICHNRDAITIAAISKRTTAPISIATIRWPSPGGDADSSDRDRTRRTSGRGFVRRPLRSPKRSRGDW